MFPYQQYSRRSGQARRFKIFGMKTANRFRGAIVRKKERAGTPHDRVGLINGTFRDKGEQSVSVSGCTIDVP